MENMMNSNVDQTILKVRGDKTFDGNRKEAVQILVEVFNQKHNPFDNEVLINWLDVEQVEIQDLEAVNLSSPILRKAKCKRMILKYLMKTRLKQILSLAT